MYGISWKAFSNVWRTGFALFPNFKYNSTRSWYPGNHFSRRILQGKHNGVSTSTLTPSEVKSSVAGSHAWATRACRETRGARKKRHIELYGEIFSMITNIILKHFKWKIINLKLTYYSFNIFLPLSLSRYNLSWVIWSLQQLLPAGMNIFFISNKKNYKRSRMVFFASTFSLSRFPPLRCAYLASSNNC